MAPRAPPAGTASFYKKYLDGNGIPVQSSAAVADAALEAACTIVVRMLSKRDDVRQAMIGQQMRVAMIGENEVTTDVPEYANLNQMFPQQDWDRLRGVGATLHDPGQLRRRGEPALPRGRLLRGRADSWCRRSRPPCCWAWKSADSTFDSRLRDAYDAAISAGLVAQHLRRGEHDRVLRGGRRAEPGSRPTPISRSPTGRTTRSTRRAELRAYDPTLAALIAETMPDDSWRPKCP